MKNVKKKVWEHTVSTTLLSHCFATGILAHQPEAAAWNVNRIPANSSFVTLPPDMERMAPFVEKAFSRYVRLSVRAIVRHVQRFVFHVCFFHLLLLHTAM